MYASPQMGQMPRSYLTFDFKQKRGSLNAFLAPQSYMQAPPPGQYPPPPNGAGPRPSMPPTPIPSHAHPYYHQSPQRMSHNSSFPLFIQFMLHSSPSCPVSDDDAPAWWTWWPTARLRWRTCSSCAHGRGRGRPRMMQEVVSHCCLSVFFLCFLLGGLALCAQLRAAWLLCMA
jgi:hypothetical protein